QQGKQRSECSNCHTRHTSPSQRDSETTNTVCDDCAFYTILHGVKRPSYKAKNGIQQHGAQRLIQADLGAEDEGSEVASQGGGQEPECSHCHARKTSVWRRDSQGNQVCNGCGIYEKLHLVKRPL
ncbi:hypothetical protein R3P38DRAFT_2416837, partial [Favolaschia claudopus]